MKMQWVRVIGNCGAGGRRLTPGETLEISDHDAGVLLSHRLVELVDAPSPAPAPKPEPAPKPVLKPRRLRV